jgi:hypothetical protein
MQTEDKTITAEKCKDSGLALVLIALTCYQVWKQPFLMLMAMVCLLVTMTYPPLFKPFARFWFEFSTVLGTVVSKLILSLLFFVVVLPVALVRRPMGKDAMQIKCWKKGKESVFKQRGHFFTAKDLVHP